jgi:Zn-dependent protease
MSREEPSWWKLPGPAGQGGPAPSPDRAPPPVEEGLPPREPTVYAGQSLYRDPAADVEPSAYPDPTPVRDDHPFRDLLRRIWAPIAAFLGIAVKFGLFSIKFFGIFIAIGGYALIWGWKFAVGFVALILVHELGHYVEAKRQGLDPSLPVFVPFLMAYVKLKGGRPDPWRNALVSLAGPIAGAAAAAVVFAVGKAHHSQLLLALAYTGFLLNLFNLIPIGFLDGGHVLASLRALLRGEGRTDRTEARQLGVVVGVLYVATAVALVLGMMASHVVQHRL